MFGGLHFKINLISSFMHICSFENLLLRRKGKDFFEKLIQNNIIDQADQK